MDILTSILVLECILNITCSLSGRQVTIYSCDDWEAGQGYDSFHHPVKEIAPVYLLKLEQRKK